ncbi:MAG TPA: type I polyketide synthase [Pyrinomonadaceae bacterium]|nr:type I polyketide synthase [Pyrinomonadaceae bacterium]
MTTSISIVGIACCYPDARNPAELWENVVAQRRAFRRMPTQRLRLADYVSSNREAPDCLYSTNAAVIKGYEFDRTAFRVAGSAFRSADMAHWLALDVAAQVLEDAGFPEAQGLPLDATGVFVGNTLTGEFSRANTLRLRWPYVRRTLEAALINEGWSDEHRREFLSELEANFKKPFAPVGEETLAGGLSNTIAGRVCNHFDFRGGGYTVDGACASSLVAVTNACSSLAAGDLDVAVVGGVDLSLDPFELVGFAKTGALAANEMRVYDEESNGFWPGEGCGFALLMRSEDALARRLRIYAEIKGWAISSDGHGGITRPEIDGQALVLKRAYARAGFDIATVSLFEGHGTGTSVGDAVELKALSKMIRESEERHSPAAAIGSIKANIGHTKAAAGMAGLIKTVLAVHRKVLPPATACVRPHSELRGESAVLRVVQKAEPWPDDRPVRAGVSAMGFGGINAHVVLEGGKTGIAVSVLDHSPSYSSQDAELFLFSAREIEQLRREIDRISSFAGELSFAELSDLAAHLQAALGEGDVRAAVIASTPAELVERLGELRSLAGGDELVAGGGVFFGRQTKPPRIGFLFPGQGSPSHLGGGALRRRFEFVDQLYSQAQLDASGSDATATATAQPAIVTASVAALHVLESLNVDAQVAVGHSLGELTALHWGGAIDEQSLLRVAKARGLAMSGSEIRVGAMASLNAPADTVQSLLNGEGVGVAAINSPSQTVISGPVDSVDKVLALARAQGLKGARLSVPLAFHSQLLAPAVPVLASRLAGEDFSELKRKVVSTITGAELSATSNIRELLYQQITAPVRFLEAVTCADAGVDLWVEVGPGQVLKGIVADVTGTRCVSLDAGGESLRGLLNVVATAFVMGQPVNHEALFSGRFTRPFDIEWKPKFFVNPCELAPVPEDSSSLIEQIDDVRSIVIDEPTSQASALDTLRQLVAERAELPASAIDAESRFLSDLHLNSITVGQLVAETARRVSLPVPISPMEFADAKIREVAEVFEAQLKDGSPTRDSEAETLPAGLDSWVRPFKIELVETALTTQPLSREPGQWKVFAAANDPFADSLRDEFARTAIGDGILVCLPPQPDESIIDLLLPAARAALAAKTPARFVLVQQGRSSASFARTLYAEAPRVDTCVITIPPSDLRATNWVIAEAAAAKGYVEAHYDENGRRYEPVVRPLTLEDHTGALPLSNRDLLIVTGGGKGITAECALALAKESGARLVLVGRSQPDSDEELFSNLKRFTAAGIDFRYTPADITDAARVRELVHDVEAELGPVTGILHGAARNVPHLLATLDEQSFRQTLAVKVQGARNLLAAINPDHLRLLVTFGSIIARTGLPGEADYGLANEWLAQLTEEWSTAHAWCRCVTVEWSVWAGQGMGARLGRTRLLQQGVTPISTEHGVAALRRLLVQPLAIVPVVVMSRFSDLPGFRIERPELPFMRFLEEPRTYYPRVELIVDVKLSADSDPYLDDHQFQGTRLFPAVMGLEAMAQVAMALANSSEPPMFEDVRFDHPVVVAAGKASKIRIGALMHGANEVSVALRAEETAFQLDHFQARCRFSKSQPIAFDINETSGHVNLNPERDLYGDLLFHTGRFRRLANYRLLKATACVAEITPDTGRAWFSQYLPATLVLGDPGARDAAIHAIQACIPHLTILPTGVERLTIDRQGSIGPTLVHARERSAAGNTFVYDVVVTDVDGRPLERWDGLRLNVVSPRPTSASWPAALLGPYLERRSAGMLPAADMAVVLVQREQIDGSERSDLAFRALLGGDALVLRRSDGKPEVADGREISAAHNENLTLAVAASTSIACDIEEAIYRPPCVWRALIGDDGIALVQLMQRKVDENGDLSATRVWAARECLKKAGAMVNSPLVFVSKSTDGWVVLSSGLFTIATYKAQFRDRDGKFVIALLAGASQRVQHEEEELEVSHASV